MSPVGKFQHLLGIHERMYTTVFYFHNLFFFRTNCSSGPVDAAVINHPAAAALRPTPANPLQAAPSLCATELPSAADPALTSVVTNPRTPRLQQCRPP